MDIPIHKCGGPVPPFHGPGSGPGGGYIGTNGPTQDPGYAGPEQPSAKERAAYRKAAPLDTGECQVGNASTPVHAVSRKATA